jgi:hypothetical protein
MLQVNVSVSKHQLVLNLVIAKVTSLLSCMEINNLLCHLEEKQTVRLNRKKLQKNLYDVTVFILGHCTKSFAAREECKIITGNLEDVIKFVIEPIFVCKQYKCNATKITYRTLYIVNVSIIA